MLLERISRDNFVHEHLQCLPAIHHQVHTYFFEGVFESDPGSISAAAKKLKVLRQQTKHDEFSFLFGFV